MNSRSNDMRYAKDLRKLGACHDAIEWLGDRSIEEAWPVCERADWMLWLIGKIVCRSEPWREPWSDDRKPLVACAMECALTAKKHWPKDRASEIGNAVKVVLDWTKDKATTEQAKEARAVLLRCSAYAYAASAAAACAYAAYAGGVGGVAKALKAQAKIVLKHYPQPPAF